MIDLEAIYRAERGRVLASLIRLLGSFDLAEEALHEAFLAASRQWPAEGVPANPRAWLVSAGRFRMIDQLRRRRRFAELSGDYARTLDSEDNVQAEPEEIADDTLRLVFVCCHPLLTPDAQIALTLREVGGLTTEEIASAFLATPAAIAQRIVRAKNRLRDSGLAYEVPPPAERAERLDAVLHVLYLIFNEGYAASRGDALIRHALCGEAIRLARLLKELHPAPDVDGLLALFLLHQSRARTREDAYGNIVLLEDQDRAFWDRDLIAEGTALAELAFARPPVGAYTIQALIAATHAAARESSDTNWPRIVSLYDLLRVADPSPIVELNRAVAIAMRDGPEAGLALIDPLAEGPLAGYRFAHAARADLLRRMDRNGEARLAYERALALTTQRAERSFIEKRLADPSR
ncbi:MAG TPA: RNA polymerase sigma factor [Devosia sp.]|nr:RNA polymerase sigma factor [Devosia sp.]